MNVRIYIDADGCPVKDETYKVAERYQLPVIVVANHRIKTPQDPRIQMVVASTAFDGTDDWIVGQVGDGDIVITGDILLAERCVKAKARAVGLKGNEFTEDNVGTAVAMRELSKNLRHMGESRTGPSAMDKKDRSKFLATLDEVIQQLKRR